MNAQAMFEALINQFASQLGQASLPMDEDGVCSLVVDNKMVINLALRAEAEALVLFAPIGTVPETESGQNAVFRSLLQVNAVAGPLGYVTGLAEDGRMAMLSIARPIATVEWAIFEPWLGAFIDLVEQWRERLVHAEDVKCSMDRSEQGSNWLEV